MIAQSALELALLRTNPDEVRKWLLKSLKVQEFVEALRRFAASGNEEAKRCVDFQT